MLGTAPAFTDNQDWFNTPGDKPLTMAGLRGHVVLVDFWTYTCINCIRTLPYLKRMYATYHRYGLDIVGVETPEFTFEQEASNVRQAISTDGIKYPVVQDNRYGTWNAYHNQYWPAEYFIDAQGKIRHIKFGEGDYEQDEAVIRQLLFEAGARHLPPPVTPGAIIPSKGLATPETYVDSRARRRRTSENWSQHAAEGHPHLPRDHQPDDQPVLARRDLEHQLRVRHRRLLGRLDHRHLPGPARLPGDDLGGQRPAHRSGAARRQADRGRPGRAPTSMTGASPSAASGSTRSSRRPTTRPRR